MTDPLLPDVEFMYVQDVAEALRVSRMTVYRLVHSGALRAYQVRRNYRIDPRDFVEYVRSTATQ